MIASACTYLPPIWLITSAYSFSAPIAVMVVADTALAEVPLDEADDEQALASRAAASGRATATAALRVRMTFELPVWGRAGRTARGLADEHRYGNHFH